MKEILTSTLKSAESYLSVRSKRELALLFVFCFLVGFLLVFSLSFERTMQSLEEKEQTKTSLKQELLKLKNISKATKNLENNQSLKDSIQSLEQKIALQDKQKSLLQNQSSVYALTKISDSKGLQDFTISQEGKQIYLSAKGKYENFFGFLENLESQTHLQIHSLCLYPNASRKNLEFYLEVLLHKGAQRDSHP